jgi:hypothetical protein
MNVAKIKDEILKQWPKLEVETFKSESFRVGIGDDYTWFWVCIVTSEKDRLYTFVSTGNDEIKDSNFQGKFYNFDPNANEIQQINLILMDMFTTFIKNEKRDWEPIQEECKKWGTTDFLDGEHSFQKLSQITGIK